MPVFGISPRYVIAFIGLILVMLDGLLERKDWEAEFGWDSFKVFMPNCEYYSAVLV